MHAAVVTQFSNVLQYSLLDYIILFLFWSHEQSPVTNSLTIFMEQGPPQDANIIQIPHILCKLYVPHYVHKSPPLVPMLNHINSARALPSCFFIINFYTILPSMIKLRTIISHQPPLSTVW